MSNSNDLFELDKLHEECGVFGIYSHKEDVPLNIYWGLYALQHRGQESCGIAVSDGSEMQIKLGMGLVQDVFKDGTGDMMGFMGIGHARYSTTGSSMAYNIQPLKVYYDGGNLAMSHNGNIANAAELRARLMNMGSFFKTTVDSEVVLSLIARSTQAALEDRVADAANQLKGAFSFLFMDDHKMLALRDPYGFRPLCLGKMEHGWVVASESCALDLVGAQFVRDVESGEMLVIDDDDKEPVSIMYAKDKPKHYAHCIFEYVYFARTDSVIDGQSVYEARVNMGRELAKETKDIHADIVISVPDSGTAASIGYSLESGIPFMEGLTKNRYIGRTFIQPTQKQRVNAVRLKLNPVKSVVEGKSVVMVDDSIVRGTTCARIVKLLREAGATEVHMMSSAPAFTNPCYYGTDIDSRENLIACRYSVDEIADVIGADSVGFLNIDHLNLLIGTAPGEGFCDGCFSGRYATAIPSDGDKNRFERKISSRE